MDGSIRVAVIYYSATGTSYRIDGAATALTVRRAVQVAAAPKRESVPG